jgi:hypothetical protein
LAIIRNASGRSKTRSRIVGGTFLAKMSNSSSSASIAAAGSGLGAAAEQTDLPHLPIQPLGKYNEPW